MRDEGFGEYVGLKHQAFGRDRIGIDCWGLVRLVYRERLGVELNSLDSGYAALSDREAIEDVYLEECAQWLEVTTPQALDVVIFRLRRRWSHVGLMVNPRDFLHSYHGKALSGIESLTDKLWELKQTRFYRLPSRSSSCRSSSA